jgi:pyruvate dehydrogenase E2 component (dihydrolipoamide acetyltransferase)
MKKEIKVPDIAESVQTGMITSVLVKKGDHVSIDQPVVEIETDKASTDIPSPFEGVVDEIKVKEGDEVKVNQVIMILETVEKENETDKEPDKDEGNQERKEKDEDTVKDKEQVKEKDQPKEEKKKDGKNEKDEKEEESPEEKKRHPSLIPAAPSVRRMARELKVDLEEVKGSGPGERISAEDVTRHSEQPKGKTEKEAKPDEQIPDFSKYGPFKTEKVQTIRRITAENVTRSWQNIPHVTQFDEADVTDLEKFRKQHLDNFGKNGTKLTVTAILLKITGFALQKFPRFNSSLNGEQIILKQYFNIGVAVDTQQGLLVPVIRDVNSKSLMQLAAELDELAQKARDKKISLDELQGGNFTISNLGGIGGTAFTPIILPPQVAILGVSRATFMPVYEGDELQKRMILPMSLSYDHRVIDGADGARFLRWICDVIEDPYALFM